MCQNLLAASWYPRLLLDFNFTPYQSPQHPWYWNFRWIALVVAIRAVFWLVKQLPKENKSLRKPAQKSSARSYASVRPEPVASKPAPARDILILKDGQQLGPYPLEEINRQLSAHAFEPSDLAWYEGLAEWQPLSSIAGVVSGHVHHLHPPPPPVRGSGWSSPSTDNPSAPSSSGVLISGYICAAVSLLFLPPVLGLAGIICGVVIVKRKQANQGIALLVVSFVCAIIGMVIGATTQ